MAVNSSCREYREYVVYAMNLRGSWGIEARKKVFFLNFHEFFHRIYRSLESKVRVSILLEFSAISTSIYD